MVEDFMDYEASTGILQLEEMDKILIIKIWQITSVLSSTTRITYTLVSSLCLNTTHFTYDTNVIWTISVFKIIILGKKSENYLEYTHTDTKEQNVMWTKHSYVSDYIQNCTKLQPFL